MRSMRNTGMVSLMVVVLDVDCIPDDTDIVVDDCLYGLFFKVDQVVTDNNRETEELNEDDDLEPKDPNKEKDQDMEDVETEEKQKENSSGTAGSGADPKNDIPSKQDSDRLSNMAAPQADLLDHAKNKKEQNNFIGLPRKTLQALSKLNGIRANQTNATLSKAILSLEVDCSDEPSTYTKAMVSGDREKWMLAMQEKMQSLEKNGTWDIVRLPAGKKARLVVKGFSQIPSIDYNDVFSPVVKHSSIRAFLGIVATCNLELEQLNVKTVFLYEEEVYMDQSEGFIIPSKKNFVCKLKKSLYSLKQSSRQWYKKFDSFMIANGFKRSLYDSYVYVKFVDGSPIYLLLSSEFETKDIGAAKKILGIEISRDRKSGLLFLSQHNYFRKVLCRFNMHDSKPVNTPIAPHFKLLSSQCPSTDSDFEYMSKVPYFSVVGSLMYAMVCSRPDLSYAMNLINRYMVNPVGGYAVSWRACLRPTFALSMTEAEFIVVCDTCKETVWLKRRYAEFSEDTYCINLFCDSQSAIHLTKDQMCHERTKHIDVKYYYYVREVIAEGRLKVCKISIHNNPADMMTKPPVLTSIDEQCVYKASIHLFPSLFGGLSGNQLPNGLNAAAWVQLEPINQQQHEVVFDTSANYIVRDNISQIAQR
ncbi:hypothetical protein U9M48_024976 [Paspalum notatum var. saurae]|uniref:Reverse transcriptase Ty1/copia-type domain-containing protein n=1 Tax=Paspalum notatum var. saurae TaxID=547442 RepID=A0AAQ3TPU8_PASNO